MISLSIWSTVTLITEITLSWAWGIRYWNAGTKIIFGVTCYEDVMFILIADGHSSIPNRYICFNDASLRIMVVAQEK